MWLTRPTTKPAQGKSLPDFILAIDQGTTSTRAIVFDAALTPIATAQQEFAQLYPAPGLVEHDPEAIWSTTLATARAALDQAGATARAVAALGITNQRETALIWDRATGCTGWKRSWSSTWPTISFMLSARERSSTC